MSLAISFHFNVLNMFRTLIYPSSGAYDYFFNYHFGHIVLALMCVVVSVWLSWSGIRGLQTRQPPVQSAIYQCRIDTVNSPDDGFIVARNM